MITFIKSFLELRRLRRNIWLSEEELRQIQELKLKKLIRHAYDNVMYYHNLFDSVGIKPDDIKGVEDLLKIPITTKDTIKNTPVDELLARGVNKNRCVERTTSGSTGKPLTLYIEPNENYHRKMMWLRVYFETGYKITDKIISITLHFEQKSKIRKLGILNFDYISALLPLEQQTDLLRKAKAEVIYGSKSVLELIANKIVKDGLELKKPKLVISTGEILDNATRKAIENVFGVNPIDVYASNELGMIAWECREHHSLHINTDSLVTEFIKDGKHISPGEEGVIIGTNLHSYAMPFIRYKLGDVCIPSKQRCPCGREFPLIERIDGRLDDMITLSDGSMLNFLFFFNFMKKYNEINQYRIIQEDWNQIKVILACKEEFYKRTVDRFKEDFKPLFLRGIEFSFERVEQVPLDPSGKRRTIISKVKPAF